MKSRSKIFFFFLLFISFLFMILSNRFTFYSFKNILVYPLKPFNFIVDYIGFTFQDRKILKDEMVTIFQKNLQISRLKYLEYENENLKNLLMMKERFKEELIFSEVIAQDKVAGEFLTIDKGKVDGVEEGMPVLSLQGIVGKIVSADKYSSVVETFNNSNFRVGVMDREKKQFLLCYFYRTGLLKVENIQYDSKLKIGDSIFTSGFGKIFPENIPVGKVMKIDMLEDGDFFYVIKPFENILSLKYVFIVKMDKGFYRNRFEKVQKREITKFGWYTIYKRTFE
uniref:Cell shape-determining protein MreC n=1 Tax=candidate division WOR-3 bacterium TaxID=2052148 RepID=A0A7C3J6T5_UNCW3